MKHPRFSLEEFDALFPDRFDSPAERLKEYEAFRAVLEQAEKLEVPELSTHQRAEIFRQSWAEPKERRPRLWTCAAPLRRPAVAFAAGLILGCALMFTGMRDRPQSPDPAALEQPFTVQHAGPVKTYEGKILQALYPQIENPRMVVEENQEAPKPRRVLQGTLDKGQVYVLWNL